MRILKPDIAGGKDFNMGCLPQLNCSSGELLSDLKGASFTRSDMTRVVAGNGQSLDLAITTAEGDRVTLSSTSNATVAYATYEGVATARAFSATRTDESSLSIQGELSKGEVRDIAKAIHTYNKVLKDISSGRLRPAEVHTRQLSRLDEIASFAATHISQQFISAQTQSSFTEVPS